MKHLAFVIAAALAACGGKKDEPKVQPQVEPAPPKTTTEQLKDTAGEVVDRAKEAASDATDQAKAGAATARQIAVERITRLEAQLSQLDNEIAEHTAAIAKATDEVGRKAAQEGLEKVREAKAAAQKKLESARAEAAK